MGTQLLPFLFLGSAYIIPNCSFEEESPPSFSSQPHPPLHSHTHSADGDLATGLTLGLEDVGQGQRSYGTHVSMNIPSMKGKQTGL